ncbi:hypothetical protein [Bacillus sp. USDA818B3_A]|uniref:hypothetical protein n=1 Tax=Bacillus sp. USDA818B3_A TaxID=2698834 RepID=UPI0019238BFB
MTKKLRWGVLGCANIAIHSVIPAIKGSKTSEVLAIASRGLELSIGRFYSKYESNRCLSSICQR